MNRRNFIKAGILFIPAPAIVTVANIMAIKPVYGYNAGQIDIIVEEIENCNYFKILPYESTVGEIYVMDKANNLWRQYGYHQI